MTRVVFAVVAAVAILATATPAIDSARVEHTDRLAAAEAHDLSSGIDRFVRTSDPTRPGASGARWVVTLDLPTTSWGDSGIVSFAVVPGDPGRLVWRAAGGTHRTFVLDHPVAVPSSVRLGPGRHRLVVRFVVLDGSPHVVVHTHGFKYQNGTTTPHVAGLDP